MVPIVATPHHGSPKTPWKSYKLYTPQKMNGWNLIIMISLLQEKSFEPNHLHDESGSKSSFCRGVFFVLCGSLASKGCLLCLCFSYLGVDFTIFHIFLHHLSWKKPSGDGYPYDRPSKNDRTLENGTPDANGCGLGMSWGLANATISPHPLKKQGFINRYHWWISPNFMVMVLLRDCVFNNAYFLAGSTMITVF